MTCCKAKGSMKKSFRYDQTVCLRLCVIATILSAFFLNALIPSGFMPVFKDDGTTQIVICSGMGEQTISVPTDDTDHNNQNNDKAKDNLCAYQSLASAKTLVTQPSFHHAILDIQPVVHPVVTQQIETQTHLYVFSARAPPRSLV
jgi:hypothetical protein